MNTPYQFIKRDGKFVIRDGKFCKRKSYPLSTLTIPSLNPRLFPDMTYRTVIIGDQEWMTQDLCLTTDMSFMTCRYKNYMDTAQSTEKFATFYWDQDDLKQFGQIPQLNELTKYFQLLNDVLPGTGLQYNISAVTDINIYKSKYGIPNEWHIPNINDLFKLFTFLGFSETTDGWRCPASWVNIFDGSREVGLNFNPCGNAQAPNFINIGAGRFNYGYFWTTNSDESEYLQITMRLYDAYYPSRVNFSILAPIRLVRTIGE